MTLYVDEALGKKHMALVHPEMECPFCGFPLGDGADVIGFTFLDLGDHELNILDDSAAHRSCLSKWTRRDEFIRYWNTHTRAILGNGAEYLVIRPDGLVDYHKPSLVERLRRNLPLAKMGDASDLK